VQTGDALSTVTFGNQALVCADESASYETAGACDRAAANNNNMASVNDVVPGSGDSVLALSRAAAALLAGWRKLPHATQPPRAAVPDGAFLAQAESTALIAFEAQVSRIIPLMNERSRTFKVEARFTKRPPQLYPNLTVEASIVLRTKENALLVPASYIVDGTYVLTGTDEKTLVKLGARDMEKVEVLDGITANTTLYKP